MGPFILILTLATNGSYSGESGVAMQTFSTLESCESAGELWTTKAHNLNRYGESDSDSFYLCVEK